MAEPTLKPFTGELDSSVDGPWSNYSQSSQKSDGPWDQYAGLKPFDGSLDAEPAPGFVARLGQGASRALDSAKTALTDDPKKIAKIAADQARTALPQTPLQRQLADEFKPYVDAANKAEGFVDNVTAWGAAGLKRAGQLLSNPAEAGKMVAEQLPNSLPGIAGGFAGAKAGAALGSLAGPVGTAVGGVLGGVAGGFAGSYGLEKGAAMQEQVQQEAQKRKIDIQNQEAVAGMVAQKQPEFEAAAQRKGVGTAGTDAILNVATMGLAGVGGRAIAKEAQALHAAVKSGAMDAAEASTRLAALESAQAARNTLGAKALRGTGVVGAEMVGEGLSEAVGQQYAYGQIDAGQVIDESLLGLGSGGAMALGSKTFNKAAGIVDQDATTQRLAAASAEIERQLQADSQVGQNAEAAATEAGSAAGSTEPQLGNTPDPLISFPDGSVGRHSEVEKYINDLPEDQRAVARAKLNAQLQAETRMVGLAEEEQGEPSVPQTAPPDGAAVLAEQQAQAQAARDAQIAANRAVEGTDDEILASTGVAMRPSEAMGLRSGPDGGALENAAALAVDTGATDQMQQAAAQAQAAEAAQKVKPANQKQEQKTQATQSVNQETGEISGMPSMADWSDVDLSAAFRNAQSKDVRRQLAGELSRRRAAREEAALQAELQPAATEPLPLPQGQVAPQSPPVNPNGDSNGTQADQTQQSSTQPAQAGSQAFAAAERHPTWRQNAIQAGRVARALGLEPKGKRLAQIVAEIDAVDAQQTGAAQDGADLSSGPIDQEWSAFAPETGTLGIARAQMPQIKAEHRGALVNFLKARGIDSAAGEVPANDLKPTQAEFAPGKVKKAREFQGSERSILVSSDGHVVDGHHQWLAKRAAGEPVKVIRLKAPIRDVLAQVAEFPSTRMAEGAARAMPAQAATENVAVKLAKDEIPGESSALAAKQRWEQAKADEAQQAERDRMESDKYNAYVREQEFQAERRRLQGDRTIQQASGKPFKTEASAKAKLDEFDLGDTHAIGQVDGGFVLRDKREGRESYMQARDAVLADMGIGENADGEIDATEPQWAEIERRIAERLGRKPAEDATQQPAPIAPANVQEGIAQARAKRKQKTPEEPASQAQGATDSGAFAQGQGAMLSRAGNAGTEAERQFKETERAYGGRAAYDRAKAAGKTRLTYGQWVQVRTPKFKAWLGDWEAVRAQQRLNAMEPVKVRVPDAWRGLEHAELREKMAQELDRMVRDKVEIEHPELGAIRVGRVGAKKSQSTARDPAKMLVAADLESLIPAAIYARSTQPSEKEQGVDGYSTLLTRVNVDGVPLIASFSIRQQRDGAWYYNAVALYDANETARDSYGPSGALSRPLDEAPIAGLHSFIRRSLERVNPDAVSKVVDPQTGEPLVMYHGTQDNFSVFDTDNSRMGPAAWFTPNKLLASGHAKDGIVMPVYLSIKRPYEAKNATEASLITADRKAELISLGYDGIHEKRGAIEQWVAFYPEQVKSATGNNGEFDGTNSDIRFSRMDDNAPTEGASNDQQQTASGIPAGLPAKRTADSERLERGINAELQRFADPSAGLFRAETVPQDQLPDALRRALGEFRAATGTQVHIFRNLTPQVLDFNGVNFRDGIVHINEDSQNPATLTAAHEWLHNLRRTDPALYAQLADEVARQGLLPEYQQRLRRDGESRWQNMDVVEEELTAAAVSDAMTDPAFLEQLAQRNQGVFRRVARAFLDFLDTLTAGWQGQGSNAYLRDVQAFRDTLAGVLDRLPVTGPDTANFAANPAHRPGSAQDKAVMQALADGKSARDVLRLIASGSKDPFRRQVARLLLKSGITPNIEFGHIGKTKNGTPIYGQYRGKTDTIAIAGSAEYAAERIFMHEAMHAATMRALAKPGLPSLQLRKLLAHVQKQKGAAGFYGTKNVDEFVAEVFTNPDFQKALRGMSAPAGNSLKSAWDGFVRILRSILGLSNDSLNALSQALELGVAAMREDMGLRKQGARGESAANFGADDLARIKTSALDQIHQALSHPGKVSLWDKTVGTMRHLAERNPAFKPVFEAAQRFIDDVSMLANDAADAAPRLMPRVETLADLKKRPITAADNKAVAKPLFEGTLVWARDLDGTPVTTDALNEKYRNVPTAEKAQILLRTGKIQERTLKMWKGLPVEQFDAIINGKFDSTILKPGVVWSQKELKTLFGLSEHQAGLYQEARAAIDRSIDMTARTDMLRLMGAGFAGLRDVVLEQQSLEDAFELAVGTLQEEARANPDMAERLTEINNAVVTRYETAKALMAQGYAPLSRFGRYTVDVVSQTGEREYFGMFESMREANLMKLKMASVFPGATVTQGTMSEQAHKLFQGITPESLEQFGSMLGLSGEGNEAQDKAFQAYLQLAKNNHSALKRLIHRKGIDGYSEDVGRVLAGFVYSNARLAAGGLNAGTLESAIENIPKEQGELRDVAMGLRSYIQDPQEEGQAIRGMLFAQYLGGSVASAIVNMTQPFQITMPWLSQFGGMRKAATQMGRALKDMGTKGLQYEADLAKALHEAEDDGTVSPQEIHALMAQARGTGSLRTGDGTKLDDARAAASNNWERVKVAWGQPFALAEQFNRRSTFIAAYRIAKEQEMASPADFARKAVLETQFLYSKANKMRWGRGAIGGTLMTFKTYSVSYLELMHRMWTQGGPEGKRAVGWAVAMLLLMGGAGGLPFMEDAEDLIDGAGQLMGYNVSTKHWRKELLRDTVGKELADFVEQGVSGLPGAPIDVSGRMGMGNLIPGTGLLLTKQSRDRDLLEIAGPAGDLVARGFSGARKALTGDVGGAALEVSPTAVRNAVKGVDMATSGIYKDTKGYKVIDTTLDEAIAKAIGFQPRSVAEVQEANSFMQRSKSFYVQTSSDIKAQWAQALFNKDEGALERVRERLADWNRDNPEQPIVVKMPDIWKRVREMGKDRTQRIADTAPTALRGQMREMAREAG